MAKREMQPSYLSWIGGTVIPRLESIKDLWITKNRWLGLSDGLDASSDEENNLEDRKESSNEYGIKYLKEKVPF